MIKPDRLRALLHRLGSPAPRPVEIAVEVVTLILFALVVVVFTGLHTRIPGLAALLAPLGDPLRILVPTLVVFTLVFLSLRDRRKPR